MEAKLFAWKQAYSVGKPAIDAQHRQLIELIASLHVGMTEGKGRDVLAAILGKLIKYTLDHFTAEEAVMRTAGYPGLAQHRGLHTSLAATVTKLSKDFEAGRVSVTVETAMFLKQWLNDHILGADHAFAVWDAARRS